MLDSSVFERSYPKKPKPLTVYETTEKVKNMCTECVISALKCMSQSIFSLTDVDPFYLVYSECVMFSGIEPDVLVKSYQTNLSNLFKSVYGQDFYEILESAHHSIITHYNYFDISQNLNTIFET